MGYSPIILFIYARPDHTRRTLEALSSNTLAQESDLFIYADGPKENVTEEQRERIRQTREVARSRQWCRTVTLIESDTNKGLAASIIAGVTETVSRYGRVIVLEDDIVTGKYFLEYMNNSLERYEDEKQVWEIAGYRVPVNSNKVGSCFFSKNESCWGWATWADRWSFFKKDPGYYVSIFTEEMIREFNMDGADTNLWKQVQLNLSGEINTWAVFWDATIYIHHGLVLTPFKSLVRNIGFDNTGENCGNSPCFSITEPINHQINDYPEEINLDSKGYNKDKKYFRKMTREQDFISFLSFVARKTLPSSLRERLKPYLLRYNLLGLNILCQLCVSKILFVLSKR